MYNIGFAISVMTADPPAKACAICGFFFISPLWEEGHPGVLKTHH